MSLNVDFYRLDCTQCVSIYDAYYGITSNYYGINALSEDIYCDCKAIYFVQMEPSCWMLLARYS